MADVFRDILRQVLPGIVETAVERAVTQRDVPLNSPAPTIAAAEVSHTVMKELKEVPEIQHQTNTEPFYQSRVTIGALAAILAAAAALGVEYSNNDLGVDDFYTQGVVIFGGFTTLYGRWVATRPLGA